MEKTWTEPGRIAVTGMLDMLDVTILSGNGSNTLAQPNQAIISESLARKLFATHLVVPLS